MGDGKDVDLKECRKMDLESQVIQYLAPVSIHHITIWGQLREFLFRQSILFIARFAKNRRFSCRKREKHMK